MKKKFENPELDIVCFEEDSELLTDSTGTSEDTEEKDYGENWSPEII